MERWAASSERLAAGQELPEVGSRASFSRRDSEFTKTFAKIAKRGLKDGVDRSQRPGMSMYILYDPYILYDIYITYNRSMSHFVF